ncbi:MAG: Lrp/AsnC family transcriptional regulator [Silicimonas sp.]|nr:Lrp/AsnC family transcriptional regulator [Silicimonas sp.]
MSSQIDQIDRAILDVLSVDGRISVTDLAERVGLSKTPCHLRLKRLQATGYIIGFKAVLDRKKLGLNMVAFVEVKLDDTREVALRAFNDGVRKVPEIEMCHMIAGAFDYLLKVRTRNVEDYRRVLGEQVSTLPHVSSTSTHVSIQDVQDT